MAHVILFKGLHQVEGFHKVVFQKIHHSIYVVRYNPIHFSKNTKDFPFSNFNQSKYIYCLLPMSIIIVFIDDDQHYRVFS